MLSGNTQLPPRSTIPDSLPVGQRVPADPSLLSARDTVPQLDLASALENATALEHLPACHQAITRLAGCNGHAWRAPLPAMPPSPAVECCQVTNSNRWCACMQGESKRMRVCCTRTHGPRVFDILGYVLRCVVLQSFGFQRGVNP
jgi:hypothetical protein